MMAVVHDGSSPRDDPISMLPDVGEDRLANVYNNVVLPHPEGPMMDKVSPAGSEKEILSRTGPDFAPNVLHRSFTCIIGERRVLFIYS